MPGGGRYQWQWIEKPPIYWTITFWITMAEFVSTGSCLLRCPDGAEPPPMRLIQLKCG